MLKPDLSLLRIFTLSDLKRAAYDPVSVNLFQRAGYDLCYINAIHVAGRDNATCKTILKALDLFQPKGIIVEARSDGDSVFDWYKKYALERAAHNFENCSEDIFTIAHALQRGVPVTGGEPCDEDINASLKGAGYTAKEIMAYWLVLTLPQAIREHAVTLDTFDVFASRKLTNETVWSAVPRAERLSLEEYKAWFVKQYPDRKHFLEVTTNDAAPDIGKAATLVHKMSYQMEIVREKSIAQKITTSLERYRSVLVVYGAGHFHSERAMLETMLGPCKKQILFPENPAPPRPPVGCAPTCSR